MLHLLYIFAFTVIAFFAIGNLVRNLITFSTESNRRYSGTGKSVSEAAKSSRANQPIPHPELLDERGQPIDEPLLVMRSVSVEDAREKLDAIYNSSPGGISETDNEA